jgi:diguanylate cyclase (GGDEF)-like protein
MEHAVSSQMFLSNVALSQRDLRLALAVVLVSVAIFVGLVPYAKVPLAQVWAFIPCYESMLVICDLVTVLLLLGQATASRSRNLLVLACAYFFSASMTVIHLLSFPGVFSDGGLLGAGTQSTAWLYNFWHGGFPLFVIAYAGRRQPDFPDTVSPLGVIVQFALRAAGCLLLAGALTYLATEGHELLPAIIEGGRYTAGMPVLVALTWSLSLAALFVLWRRRPRTVLNLWLQVVMLAWLIDIALSAFLNGARFDLGFYAGRIYGLLAASFVLMVLLVQNGMLHSRLGRLAAELQRLSGLDALTGVPNRRSFDSALATEWRRAIRNRSRLSLLMIDIDYFKNYNDAYGHVQGDACLRQVAAILAACTRRSGELCARYGGEEFAILLPLAGPDEASSMAEEMCEAVAAAAIPHAKSAAAGHVTVSIGIATLRTDSAGMPRDGGVVRVADCEHGTPDQLVELADQALYRTKSAGRNGACMGDVLWLDCASALAESHSRLEPSTL